MGGLNIQLFPGYAIAKKTAKILTLNSKKKIYLKKVLHFIGTEIVKWNSNKFFSKEAPLVFFNNIPKLIQCLENFHDFNE